MGQANDVKIIETGLLALALAACSGANDGPPPPTSCQRSDRSGTYRQSFLTQGGNCGDLDDQIVNLDAPAAAAGPGGSCSVTSERWSDNDCKLERTTACSFPDGQTSATGVSRQQTANGSTITGTLTVVVRNRDGSSCTGTYALTAVRQ